MVRSLLGGKKTPATAPSAAAPAAKKAKTKGKSRRKRNLSPESSARISDAQKRRWANFHKQASA